VAASLRDTSAGTCRRGLQGLAQAASRLLKFKGRLLPEIGFLRDHHFEIFDGFDQPTDLFDRFLTHGTLLKVLCEENVGHTAQFFGRIITF
jgi:hypothetical protein